MKDAFELNKYNAADLIILMLREALIVSYGFIDAIDIDSVSVTLTVSNKSTANRVRCKFMNLGNESFAINQQPKVGMRVVVFAPQMGADRMFEASNQIATSDGRNYIFTENPATYSSQFAFCVPFAPDLLGAINSISIEEEGIALDIAQQVIAEYSSAVFIDYENETNIEYHAGEHFRGFYGTKWEELFGVQEGINGTELEGEYEFISTFGRWSKVLKNYESGLEMTIGKAHPTPFAEDKGELEDTNAPVNITIGSLAPLLVKTNSAIDITVDASENAEANITINLKGSAKFSIVAEDGKFEFKNGESSLKDIFLAIADLLKAIQVVDTGTPAVPAGMWPLSPDVLAKIDTDLTPLINGLLD